MECPICLTGIENNFIQVSCCNKLFHTDCFIKCMNLKKNCPMCRAIFSTEPPPPQSDEVVINIIEEQQNVIYTFKRCISFMFFVTIVSLFVIATYERNLT
jgi:hypothetical protein